LFSDNMHIEKVRVHHLQVLSVLFAILWSFGADQYTVFFFYFFSKMFTDCFFSASGYG
jgi:hypothetical protein